jgi:hypothetical protein
MKIYHGVPTPKKIEKCRSLAPSHEHGAEWLPHRMTDHGWDYILDNGAYTDGFDAYEWYRGLQRASSMSNSPDFVVLPDSFGDWEQTKRLHRAYAWWVPDAWQTATVAQPGGMPEEIVRFAIEMGSSTIFVGGGKQYQREYADQLTMTAHDYGLRVHIGEPGPDLSWARDLGADSVDSTSIVRNGYYERLESLEATPEGEQTSLTEVEG